MNMSQGTEHSRVRLHGEVGNSSGSFATLGRDPGRCQDFGAVLLKPRIIQPITNPSRSSARGGNTPAADANSSDCRRAVASSVSRGLTCCS